MKKKIKTILYIFVMLFVFAGVTLVTTSCGGKQTTTTKEQLDCVLNDATYVYDGLVHSIEVENLPEGATVKYNGNGMKYPGEYNVTALISYNDKTQKLYAKMTILKAESVLTVEENQVVYTYASSLKPAYTLNNNDQKLVMKYTKDDKYISESNASRPGTYKVTMYAPEDACYTESAHYTVNLTIKESAFDVAFRDTNKVYTGEAQQLLLEGTLPAGYTVEYTGNEGTDAGLYLATAKIKNAAGEVLETHHASLLIDYPENKEFKAYLDDFFVMYLEEDQLSVNIFCKDPASFGLTHYDAKWYTYTRGEDDTAAALQEFEDLLAELEGYKDYQLSNYQRVAYNQIEKFLSYYIEYYQVADRNYMEILYVDSFGGYVADFGTYMEAYTLRGIEEVQDIIDYVNSTGEAFPSYVLFVEDKATKGYPLSDYTLDEMLNYLDEVIEAGENYYLRGVLEAKIDACDFLTSEEKTSYKDALGNAFVNNFVPGVNDLYNGLETQKGKCEKEGYWASYGDAGKDLYVQELKDLLGKANLDMDTYIEEIEKAFKEASREYVSKQSIIVMENNITTYSQLEMYINQFVIDSSTPSEMMEYLKEFANNIVPELETTPDIVIKNMDDASAKVSNAVAYYMKSALDNDTIEYITLNQDKLSGSGKNEVLGTLSHEGYPGHLYAYTYSKQLDLPNISKVMTSTAHGEGWATYVELKLFEYAKEQSEDENFRKVMDYLYAQQLSGFLLETRLDVGIHYQGWDVDAVASYLDKNGYNGGAAQDIYRLLIEMPTGYAAYGYGKLTFCNLHNEAKKILGDHYNEVEFNEMLLSKGWTSLGELQKTYDEYMTRACYRYGIDDYFAE